MTLLNESNLRSITVRIPILNSRYQRITGKTVYEIGCHAAGVEPMPMSERRSLKVASVPVTAGGGLIGNFAEVVAIILQRFTDVEAFVTQGTDVTGFQEAILAGADIIFTADDVTCLAYNVHTGKQSDNSLATGRAFAALLELASGMIDDEVLVLGMGKVGIGAYRFLTEKGIPVKWYDPKPNISNDIDREMIEPRWKDACWKYIIDATYTPCFIDAENVSADSVVAAPGIPFGLTSEAVDKSRLIIHDELETGIVTMICEAMQA